MRAAAAQQAAAALTSPLADPPRPQAAARAARAAPAAPLAPATASGAAPAAFWLGAAGPLPHHGTTCGSMQAHGFQRLPFPPHHRPPPPLPFDCHHPLPIVPLVSPHYLSLLCARLRLCLACLVPHPTTLRCPLRPARPPRRGLAAAGAAAVGAAGSGTGGAVAASAPVDGAAGGSSRWKNRRKSPVLGAAAPPSAAP